MHTYTHLTSSPLYTSTHHTIERLSRSSWQITSPHLLTPIPAKSYAEAKALAGEIDFNILSAMAAEPTAVETPSDVAEVIETAAVEVAAVNPFEVILTDLSKIEVGEPFEGAFRQALAECDFCAIFGHIGGGALADAARIAVEQARAKVPDDARVIELAGLLPGSEPRLERLKSDISELVKGEDRLARTIETMCDLPDTAMYIKGALILWACAFAQYDGGWPARLRLEGAALRYARDRACVQVAQEVRNEGERDMGGDRAREWGIVWGWAGNEDLSEYLRADMVGDLLPNLLSPEPEHWLPLGDGRVLVINWRGCETWEHKPISASVWLDDGGLSLLGSYVLGSGWVTDDRLAEEDVDSEALGVIIEAIHSKGLAVIA